MNHFIFFVSLINWKNFLFGCFYYKEYPISSFSEISLFLWIVMIMPLIYLFFLFIVNLSPLIDEIKEGCWVLLMKPFHIENIVSSIQTAYHTRWQNVLHRVHRDIFPVCYMKCNSILYCFYMRRVILWVKTKFSWRDYQGKNIRSIEE